jgi:glycosyltransferase involved in cell wall biosynthesis
MLLAPPSAVGSFASTKRSRRLVQEMGSARPTDNGPRILLGPVEIAGYYSGLEAGLREIGIRALAIDLEGNPFNYGHGARQYPTVVRLAKRFRAPRDSARGDRFSRRVRRVAFIATRALLLAWAIRGFDVFVFSFGQTYLGGRELPILRLLRKKIVFVFHGSDARPAYIDGVRMASDRSMSIPDCLALARRTKARIRRIERYADAVVAQPAFAHFFERPVVNFFALGIPWRDSPWGSPEGRGKRDGILRVLHSPSDPAVKGTGLIREAVEKVRSEGIGLDLIELQGVPNEVVLRELADCDFAIDQAFSDAPMVGFATEAAVAGKPSIVGGYAWAENRLDFGSVAMPPVEACLPEELAAAVRRLATDASRRASLGEEARAFVESNWSRGRIADRLLRLIRGERPEEWMFDPQRLRYVEGCGLSRAQVRGIVAAVLREGGRGALCLGDKPELEALFVSLAAEDGHIIEWSLGPPA